MLCKIIDAHYFGLCTCTCTLLNCRDGVDDYDPIGNLWIGLYDPVSNSAANCTCQGTTQTDCFRCRERFLWSDGTSINDFSPWNNVEPQTGERCVRLTDDDDEFWRGTSCIRELDYACSRGEVL